MSKGEKKNPRMDDREKGKERTEEKKKQRQRSRGGNTTPEKQHDKEKYRNK